MTPSEIVQRQVEAYNAHDLEAFVATYGDDVQVFRMPATDPSLSGKAALARFYGRERFNRPGLHAEILGRIAAGDKVVDHERIRGLHEQAVEAIAVYEVGDGLIRRVWLHQVS